MIARYLALSVMMTLLHACSGGGGGSGGSSSVDSFTITGTVRIPSGQLASPKAFTNTVLDGAHVNVCTIQSGVLAPLPAHPTVLSDASGAFVITVDKNDVPANRQMWVCAAPPASDNYSVLAPIPQDQLPQDLTNLTTVSVNPNTNTTLITRYACGQSVMLYNAGKCLETDQNALQVLNSAIDNYFAANPAAIPDLRDLSALLNAIAMDPTAGAAIDAWLATVADVAANVTPAELIADAQSFTNPTIPWSLKINTMTCSNNGGGQVTVAALGTASQGSFDTFTIYFDTGVEQLWQPTTLMCGTWSASGGGNTTCTKLSVSGATSDWSATYTYYPPTLPANVTLQLKGYVSGNPTVVVAASRSVTCN